MGNLVYITKCKDADQFQIFKLNFSNFWIYKYTYGKTNGEMCVQRKCQAKESLEFYGMTFKRDLLLGI